MDRDALDPILMVPLIRVLEVRPAPVRTSVSEDDDDKVEARERRVSDGNVVERRRRGMLKLIARSLTLGSKE